MLYLELSPNSLLHCKIPLQGPLYLPITIATPWMKSSLPFLTSVRNNLFFNKGLQSGAPQAEGGSLDGSWGVSGEGVRTPPWRACSARQKEAEVSLGLGEPLSYCKQEPVLQSALQLLSPIPKKLLNVQVGFPSVPRLPREQFSTVNKDGAIWTGLDAGNCL